MSWPMVKLGEIFTISRGGSPRPIQDYITDSSDGVNWIMIGDTEPNSKYIKKTAKKIKFEGVKKSRKVYSGDLLLTNSMSFGRPYILDVEGCIHDGWLVLSPKNDQIHIDYFYHYLNSPTAKIIIENKAAGAVVKNLNSDIVRNLEVPFPPLAEQIEIASTLDKADNILQKRNQAIKLAEDFLHAAFLELFGDPVENPKKFKKSPITELADVITGFAFKSNKYINDSSEAVRLCRGANTLTGYLDWADTKFWPKNKLEKLDNYLIKAGDIILAMDRPWISSGLKVCIFPENQRETYLVQRVARLRPRCESYTNYIYSCIKSPAFEKHCCPTETTVPHISPVELKKFEVLIPPDELMANFHSIVSIINNSLNKMASGDIDSDALFSKLSQQAFSGHLKR